MKRLAAVVVLMVALPRQGPGAERPAESELRKAAAAWQAAVDTKDANLIASFFAEDALAMYPKPAPTSGREANREAWADYYKHPNSTHPISTERVTVSASGDMGWTIGTFTVAYDEPEGRAEGEGLYVAVWRKAGPKWQIVALSANEYARNTWPKF